MALVLPPGPKSHAAVQAYHWAYRPLPFLEDCRRRYGDVFTVRLPILRPLVLVSSPEHVEQLFTGDPEVLHAGKGNRVLEPSLGRNSLLLLDGPEHKRQRRLLLPPFHGERMQAYGELMREIALADIATWPVGRPFALHDRMQAITLDVILRAVFGLEDGGAMRDFAALLVRYFTPPPFIVVLVPALQLALPFSPHRRFIRLRAQVDGELYRIIAQRRADPGAAARTDILSLLLAARDEDGAPMSDVELRDQLMTLIAAGHETTATALSWAVERLLAEPQVAERLTAEVLAAGGADLDLARIKQLPYLDAVVKETLRVRPVLPLVLRRLQADWSIGGYELPAGTFVGASIYLAHRRPETYPDPMRFAPERFLDAKPDPFAWLPFGGGQRRCIGMAFALYEMAIVLAMVVATTRLRRPSGRPITTVRRTVVLAPSGGMQVVMDERPRLPTP